MPLHLNWLAPQTTQARPGLSNLLVERCPARGLQSVRARLKGRSKADQPPVLDQGAEQPRKGSRRSILPTNHIRALFR